MTTLKGKPEPSDVGKNITLKFDGYKKDEKGLVEKEVFVEMCIIAPRGTLFIFNKPLVMYERAPELRELGKKCKLIKAFIGQHNGYPKDERNP